MFQRGLTPPDPFRPRVPIETLRTQDGMCIKALGELGPLLLIFVPALGGMLCRELLSRVRQARSTIEEQRTRIVLVHMGEPHDATGEFARFDLSYVAQIADPARDLYRYFEIGEATVRQRLRPAVFGHVLGAARHGRGRVVGEPNQLAGAILWRDGKVARALRPSSPGASLPLTSLLV